MRQKKRLAAAIIAVALVLTAGVFAMQRGAFDSAACERDAAGATPRLERVGGEANPCNCTQRVEP